MPRITEPVQREDVRTNLGDLRCPTLTPARPLPGGCAWPNSSSTGVDPAPRGGMVEWDNRTLLEGWAYARAYSSGPERAACFNNWLHVYNHHRGHTALNGRRQLTSYLTRCVHTPRPPRPERTPRCTGAGKCFRRLERAPAAHRGRQARCSRRAPLGMQPPASSHSG